MLRIENLDAVDVRVFDRRCIETPRAAIRFTDYGVPRFITLFRLVFERVLDSVSFARVLEFFNGTKRVADIESDNWNIYTAQNGRGTYK